MDGPNVKRIWVSSPRVVLRLCCRFYCCDEWAHQNTIGGQGNTDKVSWKTDSRCHKKRVILGYNDNDQSGKWH